jgi:hypothetical protein
MPCSIVSRASAFPLPSIKAYLIALGIALCLCASRVVTTVLVLLLLLLLTTAEHGENRGSGHRGSRGLNKAGSQYIQDEQTQRSSPLQHRYIVRQRRCRAEPDRSIEAGVIENRMESRRTSVLVCSTLGSVASAEDILNVCVSKICRWKQQAQISRL